MKIIKRCEICEKDKPRKKFFDLTKKKPKKSVQRHINYGICKQCQEERVKKGESHSDAIGNVKSGRNPFKKIKKQKVEIVLDILKKEKRIITSVKDKNDFILENEKIFNSLNRNQATSIINKANIVYKKTKKES